MRYTLDDSAVRLDSTDFGYLVDVRNFRDRPGMPLGADKPAMLTVGIITRYVQMLADKHNTFQLGRVFGIIPKELPRITSAHLGLQRPMRVGDDNEAQNKKIAVVMHPTCDLKLQADDTGAAHLIETAPIERGVFIALLSDNSRTAEFPNVEYWLEHCYWEQCDDVNPMFPRDYMTRYKKACIWTG